MKITSKKSLHIIHQTCQMNLGKLQTAITAYMLSMQRAHDILALQWEDIVAENSLAIMACDNFVSSVTSITAMADKSITQLMHNDFDHSSSKLIYHEMSKLHAAKPKKLLKNKYPPQSSKEQSASSSNGYNEPLSSDSLLTPTKSSIAKRESIKANDKNSTYISAPSSSKAFKKELSPTFLPIKVKKREIPENLRKYSDVVKANNDNTAQLSEDSTHTDSTFEETEFDIIKKDVHKYEQGSTIKGAITFIKNLSKLEFYIFDVNDPDSDCTEIKNAFQLRQYINMPPPNEVFGLFLEDHVFRALRKTYFDKNKFVYFALLIDFGEVVKINENNIMYYLPKKQQITPAQAMKCVLNGLEYCNADREVLKERLSDLLYCKGNFILDFIEKNVLYLTLMDKEEEKSAKKHSKNPFIDSDNDETNPMTDINKNYGDDTSLAIATDTKPFKKLPNGLTEEELQMLFEDEPCTSNALEAVMGYKPQDEKRLCKFYDPKIQGCFKGIHCKLDHEPLMSECWTKDVVPCAKILREPSVIVYEPKQIIRITPTFVSELYRFYGQIEDPMLTDKPQIWGPEEVQIWESIQPPPPLFSLVLAKYDDDLYYRAKVLEYDDIIKKFLLFFVDYGNEEWVPRSNLAHCPKAIQIVPHQAEMFYLANIQDCAQNQDERNSGVQMLSNCLVDKIIDVEVEKFTENLNINFIESTQKETIEKMINLGYIKRKF